MNILGVHHIAIICTQYNRSKSFYTKVFGLTVMAEHKRSNGSIKLDLALGDQYIIELFYIPGAPMRLTRPEAAGLRHVAFEVQDLDESLAELTRLNIPSEIVRIDPYTGRKFTFVRDPDGLPIELYEA